MNTAPSVRQCQRLLGAILHSNIGSATKQVCKLIVFPLSVTADNNFTFLNQLFTHIPYVTNRCFRAMLVVMVTEQPVQTQPNYQAISDQFKYEAGHWRPQTA